MKVGLIKSSWQTFIPIKYWFVLIIFTFLGMYMNNIIYNNTLSMIMQTGLLGVIFIFYRNRPSMLIVAYILLSILPTRMYGGFFAEEGSSYYTLNSKIAIGFTILFLIYQIYLKRSIRISFKAILFIIFVIFSYAVTISEISYTIDFWWICIAYLILPLFINEDRDIRLILTAYILAVDAFSIKVLPVILSQDLYRGWLNLDPNFASLYLLIGAASVLTILTQYKDISGLYKIFLLVSFVISVITMANFASRTAFLLLTLIIIMYLIFNSKSIKTIIVSNIIIIVSYILLNQNGIFESIFTRFGEANANIAGGRFIIQQELLNSFYNSDLFRFFFGYGFLTSNNFGAGMQAHNSFLSILIGFGLIGLLSYFYYLIKIYYKLHTSSYKSFLIIFFLFLIYGFSLEPYNIIECVIFFCLLSGISNIDNRKYRKATKE